jgi:hypothetical protein
MKDKTIYTVQNCDSYVNCQKPIELTQNIWLLTDIFRLKRQNEFTILYMQKGDCVCGLDFCYSA